VASRILPIVGDVALPLGSRALVAIGASPTYLENSGSWLTGRVPISLLVYLDRPRASVFVSSVRGVLRGSFTQFEGDGVSRGSFGVGAAVLGGLTYFFDEALAVRAEVGLGGDPRAEAEVRASAKRVSPSASCRWTTWRRRSPRAARCRRASSRSRTCTAI
jgi:hypothetical protein